MKLIKKIFRRKTDYYKMFAAFGENSFFSDPISLLNPEYIKIGENTTIMMNSRLDCWSSYEGEKLFPNLCIGNHTQIGLNFSAICTDDLIIGNNVLIAAGVFVSTQNHGMNPENDRSYQRQPLTSKKVVIKDGCWIGERAVILPGVTIGEKSIIGANSVVTKDVPPFSIAVGVPACVIKRWDFDSHTWVSTKKNVINIE